MPTARDVNVEFLRRVNDQVAQLVQIKRLYPPSYVQRVVMPQHEKRLVDLTTWRNSQLQRVTGFGSALSVKQGIPAASAKAFDAAYKQQYAALKTQYQATVASLKDQNKAWDRDIKLRIKAAGKDKVIISQLKAADKAAGIAYKQAIQQAKADFNANVNAMVASLAAQFKTALPPTTTVPTVPTFTPLPVYQQPSPTVAYPQPTVQPTYVYDPSTGSYIPTTSIGSISPVPAPSPVYAPVPQAQYQPMPVQYQTAPIQYATPQPAVQAVGPSPTDMGIQPYVPPDEYQSSFDYGWDWFGVDYGTQPQEVYYQPTQFVPAATQYPAAPDQGFEGGYYQLDVFGDPWGFGSAGMENNTIRRLNNLPVLPDEAYGFSQWGQVVASVVQAGAQIGAAAASQALAPRPGRQAAPTIIQQPAAAPVKKDNTLLYVAGGVGVLALIAIVAMKK